MAQPKNIKISIITAAVSRLEAIQLDLEYLVAETALTYGLSLRSRRLTLAHHEAVKFLQQLSTIQNLGHQLLFVPAFELVKLHLLLLIEVEPVRWPA
jgi:hypothetical protein